MENLKIALLQYPIFWEDKEQNFKYIRSKLKEIPQDTDIVLLPEMFNTGFSMNAKDLAEEMDGPSIQFLLALSKEKNICICGSLIIQEKGNYFNRLVWIDKKQTIFHYDKKHLFGLSDEDKHYTPGKEILIVEEKNWKICPMVCYDLRFPVWTRNDNAKYDLILFVANWPEKRIHHWNALLQARAIENQSFVIGVNRIGLDGNNLPYNGSSSVWNPNGDRLLFSMQEAIIMADLDFNDIIKSRRIYPFLKDMDSFTIN